ncbi:MAG: PLDc N-terminal domain-containing protein [Vicingaceae bacterium]
MMFSIPDFFLGAFILVPIAIYLYALLDILFSRFESTAINIICFVLVLSNPLLGAIIYFVFTKRLKRAS